MKLLIGFLINLVVLAALGAPPADNDSEITIASKETNELFKYESDIEHVQTSGNRYHIPALMKANWYRANAYCHSKGMSLIDISTKEEHDEIVEVIKDAGSVDMSFWTSGSRLGSDNDQFYWFNTGKNYNFTYWRIGEPDNNRGKQECMTLWFEHNFKWDDDDCSSLRRVICKQSHSEADISTTKASDFDEKYVIVPHLKVNWYKANAHCHSIGMKLIELSTKGEQEDVVKKITAAGYEKDSFWTSGTEMGFDQYYWFNTGKNIGYSNWAYGEPNDNGGNQQCLKLWPAPNYTWDDDFCDNHYRVMCEK